MKYEVAIKEVHSVIAEVEADSVQEALEKAHDAIEEGDDLAMEYSHTLEQDAWVVTDAEGNICDHE